MRKIQHKLSLKHLFYNSFDLPGCLLRGVVGCFAVIVTIKEELHILLSATSYHGSFIHFP